MSDQQQDDAAAAAAARAKAEAVLRVAEQAHASSSYGSPTSASGASSGVGGGGGTDSGSKPAALAAINQELNATNQAFKSALSKAGSSFRVASDRAGESIRVASDKAGESIRVAQNKMAAGIDSIESSVTTTFDSVLSPSSAANATSSGAGTAAAAATATAESTSPADDSVPAGPDSASAEITQDVIDSKILADVATLTEKISLCRSMLSSPSLRTPADVDKDETLLAVIGFLEACSPRMVDLIDVGMGGSLGPDALEKCLVANDALRKTLEDCDDPGKVTVEGETTGVSFHSALSSSSDAGDMIDEEGIPGELTAVSARTASERLMDDLLDMDLNEDGADSSGGGGGQEGVAEVGKTSGLGDS